jgi:hypothetical protein
MISAGFDFDNNHLFLLTFPLWVQLCSKWCCTEFVVCELVRDFIIVVFVICLHFDSLIDILTNATSSSGMSL